MIFIAKICLVVDSTFFIFLYFFGFSIFPPILGKFIISLPTSSNIFPDFVKFTCFLHFLCVFRFAPGLTMMHLCITQCTYWTPLVESSNSSVFESSNSSVVESSNLCFSYMSNCLRCRVMQTKTRPTLGITVLLQLYCICIYLFL